MNLYLSTTEIKAYLGITVSTYDTLLEMLNKQATSLISGILGASDLIQHKVENEIHDAVGRSIYLYDPHVTKITSVIDNDEAYTPDENDYDLESSSWHLQLGVFLSGRPRGLKINYVAGWAYTGYAILEITDYKKLEGAGHPMTIKDVTLVEGPDYAAKDSNKTTAENISNAINTNGHINTEFKAFSIDGFVYISEIKVQEDVTTISIDPVADAWELTTKNNAGYLSGIDFPEAIKYATLLLIASLKTAVKNPNVKSYTIGAKSVTFQSDAEFQSFKQYLNPFMRSNILS